MKKHINPAICSGLILFLGAAGCASTEKAASTAETVADSPIEFPAVTLDQAAMPLGDAVRSAGESIGGGIVLLNGIEQRQIPELQLLRKPYASFVSTLAESAQCQFQTQTHYFFIYPPGYESLEQVSLALALSAHPFNNTPATFAAGVNTQLFNALAMISRNLDITVIADNLIAESVCGELFLENAPLEVILEALLKSARVPMEQFAVEAADSYVFLHHPSRNKSAKNNLLGDPARLTDQEHGLLRREVSLDLPRAMGETTPFFESASRLEEVLDSISRQWSVQVGAEAALADLPVNPCVMRRVTVETALDLIIRQWPVPGIGYSVEGQTIVLRRSPQS